MDLFNLSKQEFANGEKLPYNVQLNLLPVEMKILNLLFEISPEKLQIGLESHFKSLLWNELKKVAVINDSTIISVLRDKLLDGKEIEFTEH